jgi:hypothetical protein
VRLILTVDKKIVCQGFPWKTGKVVFPRHCFAETETEQYRVLLSRTGPEFAISRVRYYFDDPAYFPSADIAVVELAGHTESGQHQLSLQFHTPKPGDRLLARSWRVKQDCVGKVCPEALRNTELRVRSILDGSRVKHLLLADGLNSSDLCFGDSGSPVYQEKQGQLRLVGFFTGRWYPFSPSSLKCEPEGHLITQVAPYVSWLDGVSIPRQAKPKKTETHQSPETFCREDSWEHSRWISLQEIMYQLIITFKSDLTREAQKLLYLRCKGLDGFWQRLVGSQQYLDLGTVSDFGELPFLQELQALRMVGLKREGLLKWSQLPRITRLLIEGMEDEFDLRQLKFFRQLESLEIRHANNPRFVIEALAVFPAIKTVVIYDVRSDQGLRFDALLQSHPKLRIRWERLRDGKNPIDGQIGP